MKVPAGTWRINLCVGLISAGLIGYEVVLMRRLLIERWHHFGFLVISVALLGFGASGTLLAVLGPRIQRHADRVRWATAIAACAAMVLLPRLASSLPVTARFLPQDAWIQLAWWSLYWVAVGAPFLFGAAHVGAAMIGAGDRVGTVYGSNLFGSAIGAIGGVIGASILMPAGAAALPVIAMVCAAILAAPATLGVRRAAVVGTCFIAATAAIELAWPLHPTPDEFKSMSRVRELAGQGDADLLAAAADPHGYVEVYASDLFHDLPFLAISTTPPPMASVLINGDSAGSILRIGSADDAAVMDGTLMSVPYELAPAKPRVLLIGEIGGSNVWLARRRGAASITVVQPNGALVGLLRGPLREIAGSVFDGDDVEIVRSDPRRFVESTRGEFDVIQIVSLEGLGVGSAGARGLSEDHLVTVEGIGACLERLSPGGVLSICRGLQFPERENIRIFATLATSIAPNGDQNAGDRLVQVRDYLGACTMALRSPLGERRRERLRSVIEQRGLTPVWFDGLDPARVNRPDSLPGPAGSSEDWLRHAARRICSPEREAFFQEWMLNVRPASDDQPFFWDFHKRGAIGVLRQAYGDLWLTRAELGRLFLHASLVATVLGGVVLILGPLLLLPAGATSVRQSPLARAGLAVYFAGIGVGYMCIEMALISRAIRLVGDPVIASGAVIGGMLTMSGIGSFLIDRVPRLSARVASCGVGALTLFLTAPALIGHAGLGVVAPSLAMVAAVPLALAMGAPMPVGVRTLRESGPRMAAWAWGVNGLASVVGASLAVGVAMAIGYRYVFLVATVAYLLAAGAAGLLPRTPIGRPDTP
jgi:hypothetical protein